MPEDRKKNDKKNAKEQRKPRQRHQQGHETEKSEKDEVTTSVPKVPQKPPVYENPPPEFFKNLKRETDEILKITEEENSKYKKKEIQSNWSKYEVPIDSYEEIDEQENMGADFEKLAQEPLVAGGHFQFKHEKSWDIYTGPTQYDKYFDIDMDDLNMAVCTIPFYERNNIDQSIFKESDILAMNNRSIKFKQKYYNDKTYATAETEAHDKILNSLKEVKIDRSTKLEETSNNTKSVNIVEETTINQKKIKEITKGISKITEEHEKKINMLFNIDNSKIEQKLINSQIASTNKKLNIPDDDLDFDDLFDNKDRETNEQAKNTNINKINDPKSILDIKYKEPALGINVATAIENKTSSEPQSVSQKPVDTTKPLQYETTEDLEKWLDEFLDS